MLHDCNNQRKPVIMRKSISAPLPRRALGRTGEKLSIIGMGGIVVMEEEQAHADRVVQEAFEAG